jgi:hypothetical protein
VIRMMKWRRAREVGNLNCRDSKEHPVLHGGWMEQDSQCTYNVQLRWVSLTVVALEKQWILHILSVCLYP